MPDQDNAGEPVRQDGAPTSLRKRIERGGAVFIGGFGVRQALRLGSNLILTRLLMPEAFGLMAAAMAINFFAIMVTDIGLGSSIIRSKNSEDPAFLHTAWTIKIARNFLIWAIIAILSAGVGLMISMGLTPPDSNFADPRLPWIMVLAGGELLISAFGSINKSMAERKLAMGRVVMVEIAQQVISTIVTITAAFMGFGVWSFVMGVLAGALFAMISSHVFFAGPAMKVGFSREYASEILHFGKWLILASFFGFVTNRGDQVIFGWLLDQEQFGLYAVAMIWITAAFQLLETIARRVFYPAYSEVLRDRPKNIGKAYRQSRLVIDAGAAFLAFSGYFFADPILKFIYPPAFGDVSYYLKLLLPIIILFPFRLMNFVILASGNSRIFTLITFISGAAMIAGAPIVVSVFGIKAGIIFIACLRLMSLPTALLIVRRIFPIDWLTEARIVLLAGILIALLVGTEPAALNP